MSALFNFPECEKNNKNLCRFTYMLFSGGMTWSGVEGARKKVNRLTGKTVNSWMESPDSKVVYFLLG